MLDRPAERPRYPRPRHPRSVRQRALTLRNTKGWTIRAIAAELGVPRATVGGWCKR